MIEVIDGVEVLSKTLILKNPQWLDILIFLSAITIIPCIFFALFGFYDKQKFLFVVGCIGIAVFIFTSIAIGIVDRIPTNRYKYKVLISEKVSFTDIYQKYDILGQDGAIWILEDKE